MAISYVDDGGLAVANTSPLSVDLPTHSAGDFLLLVIADRTGNTANPGFDNLTLPAGWEGPIAASKYHTNNEGIRAYWKIAGAGETDPISVSTTGNISLGWGAVIFSYSGVHASDPLDTGYRWWQLNGQNVVEGAPYQSRGMTAGARALVLAMTSDDNTLALKSGSEEGFTQRFSADTTVGDDFSLFMADKAVTAAGDTIAPPTVEQTINTGDIFQTIGILTLRPAGATPAGPRLVHSQPGLASSNDAPTSSTIPIWFDVQEDDLILFAVATRGTAPPTVAVVTAGYTQLVANTTQSPPGGFVFYKVAAGGESSIEATCSEGNFGWIMAVQVWRGVDTSTPFDVTTQVNTGTNSQTHTAPSITPTSDNSAVVSMAMIGHDPPSPQISDAQGFQPAWRDALIWMSGVAFDEGLYAADKYVPTAVATTGPTFDNNDGNATIEWVGVSMALRPASTPPPVAPTNPAASALSSSSIRITWDDVADETGYRVERSPDGSGSWVDVSGNLAAGTVSFDDTGLAASTQYFYRIFAFNAGGDSPASTTVNATTQAGGGGGGNRMGGNGSIRRPPPPESDSRTGAAGPAHDSTRAGRHPTRAGRVASRTAPGRRTPAAVHPGEPDRNAQR